MSYHCFSNKEVKARKQHKCIWCGESINKGDSYQHEKSIYDGRFQNHHWHIECDSDAYEYFKYGDTEFSPYSNERGKADATDCDNTM